MLRAEEPHPYRTHRCGEMATLHSDRQVRLAGRIVAIRNMGRMVFLVLRDDTGEIQLVARGVELCSQCQQLEVGWAVSVDGRLISRRPHEVNPNHPTGHMEIHVASIRLVARTRERSVSGSDLGRVRVESAIREVLKSRDFTELGDDLAIADGVELERVYRIRTMLIAEHTAPAGCRRTRLAEIDCAFATLEDLTSVVRDLALTCGQSLSVHRCADESPFGDEGSMAAQGMTMLVGLPTAGHPLFAGHDVRLTALAELMNGRGDPEVAQCVLLLATGRVVGAGAVRTTADAAFGTDVVDPLVRSEIMDRKASWDRMAPPAGAWFSLDLTRMIEGAQTENPLSAAQAGHDLASLLRISGSSASDPIGTEDLELSARRIERWDIEASAAMARSRTAAVNRSGRRGFGDLLNDFAMSEDVCERLFDLFPAVGDKLEHLPEGERFEWIWSILGSESVRGALRDTRAQDVMRRAVELRIITEPRQITYIDVGSLDGLHRTLDLYPTDGPASILPLLRQVLAHSPASFTSLVEALAGGDADTAEQVTHLLAADGSTMVRAAAERWLSAPALLPIVLRAMHERVPLGSVAQVIRGLGQRIFPNQPVEPHELRTAFIGASEKEIPEVLDVIGESEPGELCIGILQHLFRPVSQTYIQTRDTLRLTADCTHHVSASGLTPGGEHWSAEQRCYTFGVPGSAGGAIRLYLSKNRASALAKASVGICTAGDLSLYHRSDHHHLNMVDSSHGVVIGNAQLHVLTIEDRQVLLIRSVNISNAHLASGATRWLVEATLRACVELAAHSGLAGVHLGEGLCFWHLDSSRPQIRAVLDSLRQQLPCHNLDAPFFLFRFGQVDVEITKTYRLWDRHRTHGQPPLHQLLKVAT
ncbi:OB-fold nucleic acid binding domain-containing protein [Nocardia sp. R7R-8]|uniref:OB-fold nucleic acid binding domain-containing protein n=1 Tax=Nocardia sp. R7R-8 TaxID=3459304 RepID=UPI00403DF8C0